MNPSIPQWKLERYVLGELPASEMQALQKRLVHDSALQAEVEALQGENQKFIVEHDAKGFMRRLLLARNVPEFASSVPQHRSKSMRKAIGTLAASFLAAVLTIWFVQNPASTMGEVEVRIKGSQTRMELWQKQIDTVAQIIENTKLKAGDLVQIRIHPQSKCYAAVLSLDGRGNWTTHLPEMGNSAKFVEPGKNEFLPYAYKLDDAPQFEAFWFVTSPLPFQVDSLIKTFHHNQNQKLPDTLPLGSRFQQVRLIVRK